MGGIPNDLQMVTVPFAAVPVANCNFFHPFVAVLLVASYVKYPNVAILLNGQMPTINGQMPTINGQMITKIYHKWPNTYHKWPNAR